MNNVRHTVAAIGARLPIPMAIICDSVLEIAPRTNYTTPTGRAHTLRTSLNRPRRGIGFGCDVEHVCSIIIGEPDVEYILSH